MVVILALLTHVIIVLRQCIFFPFSFSVGIVVRNLASRRKLGQIKGIKPKKMAIDKIKYIIVRESN